MILSWVLDEYSPSGKDVLEMEVNSSNSKLLSKLKFKQRCFRYILGVEDREGIQIHTYI